MHAVTSGMGFAECCESVFPVVILLAVFLSEEKRGAFARADQHHPPSCPTIQVRSKATGRFWAATIHCITTGCVLQRLRNPDELIEETAERRRRMHEVLLFLSSFVFLPSN